MSSGLLPTLILIIASAFLARWLSNTMIGDAHKSSRSLAAIILFLLLAALSSWAVKIYFSH